ncbi:MAG: transporter [Rhodoferax sp.]
MSTLSSVVSFALFPAIAVIVGACVTFVREPGAGMRSAVQHFAAGVIFCVLATELLPDLLHRRMPWMTLGGFTVGVALRLLLKWAGQSEVEVASKNPTGLLTALGVDVALDGVLIGLSLAAGERQGLLLTIALVLELFFLGVSCATSLTGLGKNRKSIVLVNLTLALILVSSAAVGAVVLSNVSPSYVDAILAFGVAALLYLVTEELLVEAHEGKDTPWQTGMFFLGFIALFMVDMLLS